MKRDVANAGVLPERRSSPGLTRLFQVLPWALLGATVVAAFTVFRSPPVAARGPQVDDGPPPRPSALAGPLPPLTDMEHRQAHMRIGHEECEEGMKRFNELSGRAPTDPKALHLVGTCMAFGNLAWYRCMVSASNQDEATVCNHRFLVSNP